MKTRLSLMVALCGCTWQVTRAQDAPPNSASEIQELKQQVQALTEMVHTLQQQVQAQQSAPPQQSNSAAPLPQNPEPPALTSASPSPSASAAASAPSLFPTTDESVVASSGATPPAGAATSFPTTDESVTAAAATTGGASSQYGASLAQPMTIASGGGGKNYMNVSFDSVTAFDTTTARDVSRLEVGDHDPQTRGFNLRNAELAFDGAVDPYFEGFANIVLKLEPNGDTSIELEEAFMQTTNLPFGLQLKGGQFFTAFGRINPTHPHTWDFADAPLVVGRLLGPDGLRGIGAQVSWVLPVPWYSQAFLAMQQGSGGTAYSFRNPGDNGTFFGRATDNRQARGLSDYLYSPRWENSINLSDTQTLLGGISGAFGANETGAHERTEIYGADLLYKWKSARAEAGFPFVKWQTEWMYRRFEAGRGVDMLFPVAETFHDWGIYSQVLWGWKKGWVAGVRGDYLHMQDSRFTDDPERQSRSRITADVTWYPTEFSKLRLQYQHDFLDENHFLADRDEDSVILQFEFILGAHGAHKF